MQIKPDQTIAIVGASLAGLRAAEELRRQEHRGPVILVGEELHAPYNRPPLSKQILSGAWEPNRVFHYPPNKLDALNIEFRLGCRAESVDMERKVVSLDDGTNIEFAGLIIATGVRARSLPEINAMPTVHTLRTLDDCNRLTRNLSTIGSGARVVVVGGGFIGAEVAATLRQMGYSLTIAEALSTPFERVLGRELGLVCARMHAAEGVEIQINFRLEQFGGGKEGDPVMLESVTGATLAADMVVLGIGSEPAIEWLSGSGLSLDDGLLCDECLFAGNNVVAAGDVARWFHRKLNRRLRVEHWSNAVDSGIAAARNLLRGREHALPYEPVPYFWSDQYDKRIAMLGHPQSDDLVEVIEGPTADNQLLALYRRGSRLSGAVGFGRLRQLMGFRPLLMEGASFDEAVAVARGS